jgi:hypothetical protein
VDLFQINISVFVEVRECVRPDKQYYERESERERGQEEKKKKLNIADLYFTVMI